MPRPATSPAPARFRRTLGWRRRHLLWRRDGRARARRGARWPGMGLNLQRCSLKIRRRRRTGRLCRFAGFSPLFPWQRATADLHCASCRGSRCRTPNSRLLLALQERLWDERQSPQLRSLGHHRSAAARAVHAVPESGQRTSSQDISFSQLLNEVDAGKVRDVLIQGPDIHGTFTDGRAFQTYAPNDPTPDPAPVRQGRRDHGATAGRQLPWSCRSWCPGCLSSR